MKKVRRAGKPAAVLAVVLLLCCCTGCSVGKENQNEDELMSLMLEEKQEKESGTEEGQKETQEENDEGKQNSEKPSKEDAQKGQQEQPTLFVHICGAVKSPGVYELPFNARLYEAILKAGGVREDGAEEVVNQAKVLTDGEQIYIPTDAEVLESRRQGYEDSLWTQRQDSKHPSESENAGITDKKVNINTASKEELMTLSGIGETRADSIMAYREANGGFDSVEELMQVDGIKEGVFNKIKDGISVGAGS